MELHSVFTPATCEVSTDDSTVSDKWVRSKKRTCRWKHWSSCTPETQGKLLTSFGHKHTGKPHTPQSSSANARAVCQAAASAHALMAAAQETTLAIHLPESHPQNPQIMVMWSLQGKWIWINEKKDTNMQNPSKYTATHFLNTSSTLSPRFHSICSTALFPVPGQQHPSKKVNSKEPFRSCNAGVKANAVGFLSTSADRKNSQNPSRYVWSEWKSRMLRCKKLRELFRSISRNRTSKPSYA